MWGSVNDSQGANTVSVILPTKADMRGGAQVPWGGKTVVVSLGPVLCSGGGVKTASAGIRQSGLWQGT